MPAMFSQVFNHLPAPNGILDSIVREVWSKMSQAMKDPTDIASGLAGSALSTMGNLPRELESAIKQWILRLLNACKDAVIYILRQASQKTYDGLEALSTVAIQALKSATLAIWKPIRIMFGRLLQATLWTSAGFVAIILLSRLNKKLQSAALIRKQRKQEIEEEERRTEQARRREALKRERQQDQTESSERKKAAQEKEEQRGRAQAKEQRKEQKAQKKRQQESDDEKKRQQDERKSYQDWIAACESSISNSEQRRNVKILPKPPAYDKHGNPTTLSVQSMQRLMIIAIEDKNIGIKKMSKLRTMWIPDQFKRNPDESIEEEAGEVSKLVNGAYDKLCK